MVEQTKQSENSFMKSERQNGGKTGQTCIEDISYDKDVVEIKLPDTVISSDCAGHFVKDVCIDEGVLADQKASTEKLVYQKVSPNIDSSMGNRNGDLSEEIRVESTKSAHELKSDVVILPVICASDGNREEHYSSCKVHELEGNNTAAVFTNSNDEKLSPKQLTYHEGAKEPVVTVISESSENQGPFLNGEATHQVSSNDCHETGIGIASETSNIVQSDFPVESTADEFSGEVVVSAALDMGGPNPVNHYNPFIAYGSSDDTWEPKYSLPTIVDAASIAPVCPVEKTDSFSDLVNRTLGGFDSVEIDEAIIEENRSDCLEASASTFNVQAFGESNDQRESLTNEMRIDVARGMSTATSPSSSKAEPSDVKSENHSKCEIDSAQDVHDFNPRDVEVGTKRSEDNMDNKSSTLEQTESVVQQNGTDSAKVTAQTGLRNPFESSFSGPSITSGPLTPSGHIPYSGNISLRSESSTTSTRSFAFPVLQTEWNSSPVKMAKADRRRLRQDRGWGYRILCCKF
uniref:18S pre-ribosomal assembly protein gar2-related n=1 Tax=Arundo donax TaxID=35708 RepID=A0A0A9CXB4_ARUDO